MNTLKLPIPSVPINSQKKMCIWMFMMSKRWKPWAAFPLILEVKLQREGGGNDCNCWRILEYGYWEGMEQNGFTSFNLQGKYLESQESKMINPRTHSWLRAKSKRYIDIYTWLFYTEYLSVYLLSIRHLSTCLPICISIYLSIYVSICIYHLSMYICMYVSIVYHLSNIYL